MKKKEKIYDEKVLQTFLSKYNPFGFTMEDGTPMEFCSASSAYMTFLVGAWVSFPRGYIELPLLLMKNYKEIDYQDAVKVAQGFKTIGVDMVIAFGSYESKRAKQALECICRAFCAYAGTSFSEICFKEAYDLLLHRIEVETIKSNAKNKN